MTRYPEDNRTSPAEALSRNSMQAKAQPNLVERLSPSLSWNTDRAKGDPGRQRLGTSVANGVLGVAPGARSPTIGGFVANYRVLDPTGGLVRTLSLPFTCADMGIEPDFGSTWIPDGATPADYFITTGTLHVARRAAPYPIRLWNGGPASRRAVKNDQGGIYDVDFVFSEVSAPVRLLRENASGSYTATRTLTGQTGKHISTKQMGSSFRLDLTSEYK